MFGSSAYTKGIQRKRMSVDELSMSFASSMGIENIQEEYLDKFNLYTDLDQLEKSVDAEFEEYLSRAKPRGSSHNIQSQDTYEAHSGGSALDEESLEKASEHSKSNLWKHYMDSQQANENFDTRSPRNTTSLSSASKERSRSFSPGEYFGARSFPLNSLSNVWQKRSRTGQRYKEDEGEEAIEEETKEEEEEEEEEGEEELRLDYTQSSFGSNDRHRSAMDRLLDTRFKTLPRVLGGYPKYELPDIELHHPYTQKKRSSRSTLSSNNQQCASMQQTENSDYENTRSLRSYASSKHPTYTIEPYSPLHFLCEISPNTIFAKVIHLRIRNLSSTSVRRFSLFSAKNMLDFETNEGVVLEHELVEVKIKIRSSALAFYQRQQVEDDEYPSLSDKILVLIDHQHVNELDVNIDFMTIEEDEEEDEEETEEEEEVDDDEEEAKSISSSQELIQRPKCRFCALEQGFPLYKL